MSAQPPLASTEGIERDTAALADWKAKLAKADRFDRGAAERMIAVLERRIKRANGEAVEEIKRKGYGFWR